MATLPDVKIPTPAEVAELPLAIADKRHPRLEEILGRKLTFTELSAAESMESEHASYASSGWYLKTILPTRGANHLASIGDEAAAVAMFVTGEEHDTPRRTHALIYSSESHNGPSYVCPDPGAATGVGGIIRDQAAESLNLPMTVSEARRQAHPLENPHEDPVLQHVEETTQGIQNYGNPMGIPHAEGSIKFDPRYAGNNLVNVMSTSVAPKDRLWSNQVPTTDDPDKFVAIYVSKASDKTGVGGTKFASYAIDMTNQNLNEKAVQDPDAHLEEVLFRGLQILGDKALSEGWKDKVSVKDMGAAGLLCSSLEQLHSYEVDRVVREYVDSEGTIYRVAPHDRETSLELAALHRPLVDTDNVKYVSPEDFMYKKRMEEIEEKEFTVKVRKNIGVIIDGNLVPQNEPRSAMELLEAETQERMFIYVHEDYAQDVLDIFNDDIGLPYVNEGARAAIVGRCNDTGRYTFVLDGKVEVDVPFKELTDVPRIPKPIREKQRVKTDLPMSDMSLEEEINAVLSSINFKNDESVSGHYDKHVGGTNILTRGEAAATLQTHPSFEGKVGTSVAFDSNTVYGMLDPAFQAEDSFMRGAWQMATVGCSVVGVTNNANYGRTNVPEEMWEFVQGQVGVARACRNWELEDAYVEMIMQDPDIAAQFEKDERRHLTVNSGNVSLNKANANTGTAIPPTAILGLVGWTDAPTKYTTWKLQGSGTLYLVGGRQAKLGGTDYAQNVHGFDELGGELFDIDAATSQREVNAVIKAIRSGYVTAANNIEEGGLCNAVAEMVANTVDDDYNAIPMTTRINLDAHMSAGGNLDDRQKLFSESYGMIVQVSDDNEGDFLSTMRGNGVTVYQVGSVTEGGGVLEFFGSGHSIAYNQDDIKHVYDTKLVENTQGNPVELRRAA